jgi:hypothetical protein
MTSHLCGQPKARVGRGVGEGGFVCLVIIRQVAILINEKITIEYQRQKPPYFW